MSPIDLSQMQFVFQFTVSHNKGCHTKGMEKRILSLGTPPPPPPHVITLTLHNPVCFLFNYRFLLSVHLILGSISLDHPQSGELKTVEPDPTMEESLQGMGMENGIGSAFRSARMKRERRNIVEETRKNQGRTLHQAAWKVTLTPSLFTLAHAWTKLFHWSGRYYR